MAGESRGLYEDGAVRTSQALLDRGSPCVCGEMMPLVKIYTWSFSLLKGKCLKVQLNYAKKKVKSAFFFFFQAFEDQKAEAKTCLGLATLACEENNNGQALVLLDRGQTLGGDEEFWYNFTLTKVKTVSAGRNSNAYTEV